MPERGFDAEPATGCRMRAPDARTIVEFGTSFGVSSVWLAAAVRDNGGGRVVGEYVRYMRDPRNGFRLVVLPFKAGTEYSVRLPARAPA